MKEKGFYPTEIIFSATNTCNLHCEHCFVGRNPKRIDIESAKKFLEGCVEASRENPELPKIEKIGFSGGEPFLYTEFILELTKTAVSLDLLFDQIMTNGDWWKDETDLRSTLQKVYDDGYDGKIGLSRDSFHGQATERMEKFISTVQEIFGEDSVNIQIVEGGSLPLATATAVSQSSTAASSATPSSGECPRNAPQLDFLAKHPEIKVYHLPQTYPSENPHAWNAKHWFKEDYCQGPGNILYIHADGNIAPCCGFANENPALFIGNITDSFEKVMEKVSSNPLIKRCFEEGLSHYRHHELKKQLRAEGKKLPGKTSDICTFCDYVCKIGQ